MPERLKVDAVYPNAEYKEILQASKQHFYGTFATKCVTILYAVFKPVVVALRTNSVAEVRKAILISRDQVETFYELALIMVTADGGSPELTPPSPAPSTAAPMVVEPPPPEPYVPPREEEEPPAVDSDSPAISIYAGLKEDD
ncbi:hypothetical protein [Acaryochloris sp. CCMEE 5410]|uniref:hypothetical protein n=1 Tax=Acaryochloris sp. CCMEE 5410 TaxID=310037 RepID=UPI0002483FC2|nr:hypothetical protein [Acaryochloris sp. CCMEE 5410]KAI9129877.1 hypothetical protein ON05_032670 [Acaryochloris sp. CCMEE 5410]